MKALNLICQLFEVGAFLERKESVIIHKSSDIRARLLDRLQARSHTEPASDALDLLEEIKGTGISDAAGAAPTGGAPAQRDPVATGALSHTVSLIQSSLKKEGVPPSEITDVVSDFDKP
jgi:hypothetical protein